MSVRVKVLIFQQQGGFQARRMIPAVHAAACPRDPVSRCAARNGPPSNRWSPRVHPGNGLDSARFEDSYKVL